MTGIEQWRIEQVRDICTKSIRFDEPTNTRIGGWTDRTWLAQSVLNVLEGQIDEQFKA